MHVRTLVSLSALLLATCLFAAPSLGAPTSLQDASPQQQADALIPLIWKCMHVPDGAVAADARAKIQIELIDGNLIGDPTIIQMPRTALERAMLRAAVLAVKSCNPYPKGISLTVIVNFDPNELGE